MTERNLKEKRKGGFSFKKEMTWPDMEMLTYKSLCDIDIRERPTLSPHAKDIQHSYLIVRFIILWACLLHMASSRVLSLSRHMTVGFGRWERRSHLLQKKERCQEGDPNLLLLWVNITKRILTPKTTVPFCALYFKK